MKILSRKNHRKAEDVQKAVEEMTRETIESPSLDASRLPVDPQTNLPIQPCAQPGYYPGYQTLSQQMFWDEATRNVVLARIQNVPPIRYFTQEELPLIEAVLDRILPQDDRDEAHKIPLVNYIDERLYHKKIDGYRFEDMPADWDAYRLGLQAIDLIAQHMFNESFIQLRPWEQDAVLQTLHDVDPPAAQDIWQNMSVMHFWMLLVQDSIEAYYAHPFAWDEIGFGGPAYPRGYMRLHHGEPEPWEKEEQRYEWKAPPSSMSDVYKPIGGPRGHKQMTSGQEGTH